MSKYKYIKYRDEVLKQDIIAIKGYQWPSDLKVRIFIDKIPEYYNGTKVVRYFPQIDDDIQEQVFIIGDRDKGFKKISEAKVELEQFFEQYLKEIDINEYLTCK